MKFVKDFDIRIESACKDIEKKIGRQILGWEYLSGGCYSEVVILSCNDGVSRALKLFKFPNVIKNEVKSYRLLNKYSPFSMPKIFSFDFRLNYVCMEYLMGKMLSQVTAPNPVLVGNVIDNMLKMHSITEDLSAQVATERWIKHFAKRQADILKRSKSLVGQGLLREEIYNSYVNSTAYLRGVVGDSVQTFSLLHGDFTPWNIIISTDDKEVIGVIDPYLTCFGDPEYDLMMLMKANGKQLGLVEKYQEHKSISNIFPRKMLYYNAWNELGHYYYSDRREQMNMSEREYELRQVISHD